MNTERRKFLKLLLVGSGVFLLGLLGKFLGPALNLFGVKNPSAGKEKDFKGFKVIEKKDELIFIDKKAGKEILILDWGEKDD